VRQGREIRELIEQQRQYIEEMAVRETELKVIVDTNNRLIASQNVKTEIKQNFVRMEVTIPKIIEKVITIEKFVERESD